MKSKNCVTRILLGSFLVSSFAMCTKSSEAIKPVASTSAATISPSANTVATTPVATYTVQASQWQIDGTSMAPGSVIYIPAGSRGALLLKNIKGTAAAPITIINKGGKVTFTAALSAGYTFKTQNCQYFKILGNGTAGLTYGFEVNGGNIGMTMDGLSSDFEIADVEVHGSGFAGIMAKTDPTCDVSTQRGHFTMKNVSIHNNYVHNTGGEGLYVGNSFYAEGVALSCGTVYPHDVVNLKVYSNVTQSTGCEGIQVGCAVSGCAIYNNTVKSPGVTPFMVGQNNGIQIGEGTGGKCYNNLVQGAPGDGIIVLGLGDNLVYNNYIIGSQAYGIFADSRYTPGPNFQFINNSIISSVLGSIKMNSETIPMNTVINNVLIQSSSALAIIRKSTSVKLTSSGNYIGTAVKTLKYANYSKADFHLLAGSPLINAGTNVTSFGVTTDYYGNKRPSGSAYDIGATEY